MNIPELYYKKLRHALTRRIQAGGNRILDVGCAEGMLGESLKKQGLAGEVIGIELVSDVAKVASARIDRVICGDIETIDRDGLGLEAKSFDYIICGDVLEHLRDPWETLTW
ncbi:MAG: class I SAM-dependent methyltransferase, partial [Terriglobia bacterium]